MTCKDAEDDAANGIMPVLLLTVSSEGVEPTSKRLSKEGEGRGGGREGS